MVNTYGFVYIWYDVKRKMFYVGSHFGNETDGYICSSGRMLRAFRKRPQSFKRKIIEKTSKEELHKREEYWLGFIRKEELGKKYYNLKRVASGGNCLEGKSEEEMKLYKQKLSLMRKELGNNHHQTKKARRVICKGKEYLSSYKAKIELGFNPSARANSRRDPDFYWKDEGPISEEELNKNIEKRKKVINNTVSKASKIGWSKNKDERIAKSVANRMKNNPNIGNKISETLRNKPGKKVSIDCVIYPKARVAAEALGVKLCTIKARIRSDSFPAWFYLNEPISLGGD